MARLYNSPTESIALRSLCSKDTKISGLMLSKVDSSYFHTDEGKEIFERVQTYFSKKGTPPSYKLLCEDVSLSEDSREFLRNADGIAKSTTQAEQILESLNKYRQTRLYYSLAKKILTHLEKPRIDAEKLSETVARMISKIQLRRSGESEVLHIGKDSNIQEMLEEILYGEDNDQCIPTGFKTFDSVNGGFFRGSLCTIGATSGGGKSLLANQLNVNQALLGYKTAMVPLEMSTPEMVSRTMSSVSGQSSIDIFLKRLASGERDLVYKKFRKFDRKIAHVNGRYTIFKPKEDLTIEELMAALHTFNSDVIYIDYISLLKGADGEDQWRKLGQIARFAKIYAENYNKVVVLMAQINDEGKLRYSQAVKEHSSLAWTFVANKESKEKGFLNIEMLKSRNQIQRPFVLGVDYSKMSVFDLKPEDQERMDQEVDPHTQPSKSKVKHGKASDYSPPDLSE